MSTQQRPLKDCIPPLWLTVHPLESYLLELHEYLSHAPLSEIEKYLSDLYQLLNIYPDQLKEAADVIAELERCPSAFFDMPPVCPHALARARQWLAGKQDSLVDHIRDFRSDEQQPEVWPCARTIAHRPQLLRNLRYHVQLEESQREDGYLQEATESYRKVEQIAYALKQLPPLRTRQTPQAETVSVEPRSIPTVDDLCLPPFTPAEVDQLAENVGLIEKGMFRLGTKKSAVVGFHQALFDSKKIAGTITERNQAFSVRYQVEVRTTKWTSDVAQRYYKLTGKLLS